MTVKILGIEYDVDFRGRLATNPSGYPRESMRLSDKRGVVVHYAGGAQNRNISALARWQAYARNHISVGRFARGVAGNGLMYHSGVAEDGTKASLFDARFTRWHAGSAMHNRFYVSINIPIGGNQRATYEQKVGMEELIHDYIKQGVGQDVKTVIGHQEASASLCPGTLQPEFVHPIRAGQRFGRERVVIPEVDHLIIEVPGIGKFWIIDEIYKRYAMVEEPLFIFGYPLDGAKGDPASQDFERARLHVDPGTWPERHDVQLAHVGLENAKKFGFDKHDAFKPISDPGDPSMRYFPQKKHKIYGRWKGFYEQFGDVEYFGYPVSEVFHDDDRGIDVQYFERARFEHVDHPGWDKLYHGIQLGRVNAELLGK